MTDQQLEASILLKRKIEALKESISRWESVCADNFRASKRIDNYNTDHLNVDFVDVDCLKILTLSRMKKELAQFESGYALL
jgi:hypothetical protein